MPDAPGLELLRAEIDRDHPGAVLDTSFDREQPALVVDPTQILAVLTWLREAPAHRYRFLSSLHVADYYPADPRFGVHYELLNRDRVERLRVKAMLADPAASAGIERDGSSTGESMTHLSRQPSRSEQLPSIDSCVDLFPTANFQ
ncbi:MAG TPA: NADH-quinone oxidoreductase subunit C, partial [Solirubrobacterales bacterium]|nr:NADH-quinone oxidoreductase subunit C [Solirubrobacterales bacterium]